MTDEGGLAPRGLRRTFNRAALAIALMGLTNAILVFWFLERTEAHGSTIFLVGRQKTLALEFFELAVLQDQRAEIPDGALRAAMREFDATMTLLHDGGRDAGADIPPAPSLVSSEIEQIGRDWVALENELVAGADIERVRGLTERLAGSTDAVVAALRARRRLYRRGLAALAGTTSLFYLLVSVMGSRFVRAAIMTPASRLQALARRALERRPAPTLAPLPDQGLEGAVKAVSDLSARLEEVRSERDEAQADYQAVFDNALAGIYQIDEDGRLRLVNRALAELLGYESAGELARLVNDAHRELFVESDHRELVEKTVGTDRLPIVENRMKRKDGSEVWVLESTRRSGSEGTSACEGVVFDITPRKRAFDALRRLTGRLMEIQDEERRRLARELHDSMGQLLAAIKMNLTRLEDTVPLEPRASELLRDSLELGEEASRQTRTMSHLLHPPLLEELGLEHAIRDFAAGYQKRSGIAVAVDAIELDRLPSSVETCVFRFVQESLTNVHRHSGSESATIRLFRRKNTLVAQCVDRGSGMPAEVLRTDGDPDSLGVGIRGIRARLDQLDGRLEIETSSSGTTLTATVPLESDG